MKSLLVQEYLKTHTFAELERDHGVEVSFSKLGHKFSLNYSMINSKNDDELANQCRGVILAATDHRSYLVEAKEANGRFKYDDVCPGETKIISCPFFRFFNAGQDCAAKINWNDPKLKVYEKLDGSMCAIYYSPIDDKWHVSTRSCPEADILMDNGRFTFRDLFIKGVEETLNINFDQFTNLLYKGFTYIFELTSAWNRIVCDYPETRITLLGIRGLYSLEEVPLGPIDLCKSFPLVPHHDLSDIDAALNYVADRDPMKFEGVVVCDSNFNRIKIKNINYIAINKLVDYIGHSDRNILRLILNEKDDDALAVLSKEICEQILKVKSDLKIFLKTYDNTYMMLKGYADKKCPGDRKAFAELVRDFNITWSDPIFAMYSGKTKNTLDYILKKKNEGTWHNSFIDKLLEMIK